MGLRASLGLSPRRLNEIRLGEEKFRLALGVFVGVGGVDRVPLFRFRVQLANGSGFRLGRIGGSNRFSKRRHCVLTLEYHRHALARCHEANEWSKKRALTMDCVKCLCLSLSEANHARREDLKPSLLEMRDDLPALSRVEGVGLDDSECFVASHFLALS